MAPLIHICNELRLLLYDMAELAHVETSQSVAGNMRETVATSLTAHNFRWTGAVCQTCTMLRFQGGNCPIQDKELSALYSGDGTADPFADCREKPSLGNSKFRTSARSWRHRGGRALKNGVKNLTFCMPFPRHTYYRGISEA